jgi:hypothetical protein
MINPNPVMAEDYEVQQGDCINSIAYGNGFFWETIWNHSSNADLKTQRKNPNILMPGDIVHIPDLTLKQESAATEQRHNFKLKGVPAQFRLRILQEADPSDAAEATPANQPRANAPFYLYVDDVLLQQGSTDGKGMVECSLPPDAQQGCLVLDNGTDQQTTILLNFGCLDPVEEISGVQARLRNLGYDCGDEDGDLGPQTTEALIGFQTDQNMDPSGTLDGATRDKLRHAHDIQ